MSRPVLRCRVSGDYAVDVPANTEVSLKLQDRDSGCSQDLFLESAPFAHRRLVWVRQNTEVVSPGATLPVNVVLSRERHELKNSRDLLHRVNTRRSWMCAKCDTAFATPDALAQHAQKVHQPSAPAYDRPFACPRCYKRFATEQARAEHVTATKHERCRKCGRRFATVQGLAMHTRHLHPVTGPRHGGFLRGYHRDFCALCGLHAARSHLERHAPKVKHYACPFCVTARFTFPAALRNHMKSVHLAEVAEYATKAGDMVRPRSKHTSLVIAPPPEVCGAIDQCRKTLDRQVNRWMPHVNLLYPFVIPSEFENVVPRIAAALASVQPFEMELGEFVALPQKTEYVLAIDASAGGHVKALRDAVRAPFGHLFDDLPGLTFTPHLTLAQFEKDTSYGAPVVSTDEMVAQLPVRPSGRYLVDHIQVIHRDGDVPFRTVYRIPLGGGAVVTVDHAPEEDDVTEEASSPAGGEFRAYLQKRAGVDRRVKKALGELTQLSGWARALPFRPTANFSQRDRTKMQWDARNARKMLAYTRPGRSVLRPRGSTTVAAEGRYWFVDERPREHFKAKGMWVAGMPVRGTGLRTR